MLLCAMADPEEDPNYDPPTDLEAEEGSFPHRKKFRGEEHDHLSGPSSPVAASSTAAPTGHSHVIDRLFQDSPEKLLYLRAFQRGCSIRVLSKTKTLNQLDSGLQQFLQICKNEGWDVQAFDNPYLVSKKQCAKPDRFNQLNGEMSLCFDEKSMGRQRLSPIAYAIGISHYRMWHEAVSSGRNWTLIFEEDMQMVDVERGFERFCKICILLQQERLG